MASTERRRATHTPFPLVRVVDRELTPLDEGPLFVCDVDRTYLDTRFSQLEGLAWIPFEFGVDKRAIPGSVELLRALRGGPDGRAHRPLWFVTASPPQLAGPLERKMLLDGVEWDGITYKDQLRLAARREFDQLRNQFGFKLAALLQLLAGLPAGQRMHLVGDDLEGDPVLFCLFADVAAGRLRGEQLARLLRRLRVRERYVVPLVELANDFAGRDVVAGIHVRLEKSPSGETLRDLPPDVCGYPSWAAAAPRLCALGLVSDAAARRLAALAPPGEPVYGAASRSTGGYLTPEALLAS